MSTQNFESFFLQLTYPSHTISPLPSTMEGVQPSPSDDDDHMRYESAEIRRVMFSVLKNWISVKYQVCPSLLYDLDILSSLKPNFLFCDVNASIH